MKKARIVTAATLSTFALGLVYSAWSSGWMSKGGGEPILVILVGDRVGVELVRRVISSERIVSESPGAFAMAENRIIAANAESAAEPINAMGWTDRKIELVGVEMDGGRRWERGRARRGSEPEAADTDPAKAERIAELMNKPTLNAFEAATLLRHMDATGQF
jgi:hypothetical protein